MMKKRLIIILLAVMLALSSCGGEGVKKPDIGSEISKGGYGTGELEALVAPDVATVKSNLLAATGSEERSEGKTLADGAVLYEYTLESGKAYAVVADLTKVDLKTSTPFKMKPNGTNQLISSQALLIGDRVIAGINANAFNNATNEPIGIAVQDGKQTYEIGFNDGSVCFGTTEDGKAFLCDYADYAARHKNKTAQVVSGTHLLVKDGKAEAVIPTTTVGDRAAAGFTADRGTVILVYADECKIETAAQLLIGHGACMGVDFGYGVNDATMHTADGTYGTLDPSGICLFIVKK